MNTSELTNLKGFSWVVPGATNIGIYETPDGVYVIDSGNDKEAGRKINKLLTEKNWKLSGIINTHSNADHIGGNDYLQRMTGCKIYASQTEKSFIESPKIEASFLWGGFPIKDLNNKFFEAKASTVTDTIAENQIPIDNLQVISLPGHFHEMIGILTGDNVFYIGDCMFGERTLEKYKIPYIYNVDAYIATIEKVKAIQADYYVMSHGGIETDIAEIANKNLKVVGEIESSLVEILNERGTFDAILKKLCDKFDITLDYGQYALVGNTTRSFLSYLYNSDKIRYDFFENTLYWLLNK